MRKSHISTIMNRAIVIILCLMAISLELIALALCDVAEALGQMAAAATRKAKALK